MFQGKVVVVTGGAGGIGACIAEEFRKNRATVCVIDCAEGDHYVGDLADQSVLEAFADSVIRAYGKVDVLVAGVGTGGTITGIGAYLKKQNPDIKIIAVEPASSPVLSEGRSGQHGIQGIGAGFVPAILDVDLLDEVIAVAEEQAYEEARRLAREEGILVGISSGAALHGAMQVAGREEYADKNIVVILADTGDRYLSTDMYNR